MIRAVLGALLGHWRRHPVELVTLLVGLAVATALWSGVQALNAQARESYAQAEQALGGAGVARIAALDGQPFPLADYVTLRRAGWKVSPVLEGDWRRGSLNLRLLGVEPVTLPPRVGKVGSGDDLRAFLLPPGRGFATTGTIARIGDTAGLPPLVADDDLPTDTVMLDIGVAERLLGQRGKVSTLLLPPSEAARPLPPALAGHLRIVPAGQDGDLERLTDSFHLNLTAFGFLSFVVALFIVYSAIGLAFEQRRPLLRTLRACGVSARALTLILTAELVGLALIAGLFGVVAGYGIAAALLPDVAASLGGLYGARVPGTLSLSPAWWLSGIAISAFGALAAAGTSLWRAWSLPLLATARPRAWTEAQRRGIRLQLIAATGLAGATLLALFLGKGLVAGFAAMGGLLLGAALILPAVLSAVLSLGARHASRPIPQWIWADGKQQMSGLSLALMALLLALGVNIGVGTMVGSFRATFLGWLDQRLASEVYVTGKDADQAAALRSWLGNRPEVSAILPIWNARGRFQDWPLEIYGFKDDPTYRDHWPILAARPGSWDEVAAGDGALVSEQLARRFDLRLGQILEVPTPEGLWPVRISALYSDYGNPDGQIMVSLSSLNRHWPEADRRRMALRVPPNQAGALIADLRQSFGLGADQITDQRAVKDLSRRIFEKTFAVTVALNGLTLAVAGIALLASLLTLSDLRLAQLAPVWALGLTRRQLALIELGKTLLLACLTIAVALPLGLAVAWLLTDVINARAFGWKLPILLFPRDWAMLFGLALAVAALAAAGPILRLARASPLDLLRRFSNER